MQTCLLVLCFAFTQSVRYCIYLLIYWGAGGGTPTPRLWFSLNIQTSKRLCSQETMAKYYITDRVL